MESVQACLASRLAPSGFDLIAPFSAQAYNACRLPSVPELPTFGRENTLAFVIGNTKALWPCFLRHLASHPDDMKLEAPLDAYTHASIEAAVSEACSNGGLANEVRWGFKTMATDGFVDLLRAAHVSGLAFLDEEIHLCTHPVYGPWIALRAVVIVDASTAISATGTPLYANPFPEIRPLICAKLKEMQAAGAMDDWKGAWRDWAELRTLAGRAAQRYAYDTLQMEYHYTQSRTALESAVKAYLG